MATITFESVTKVYPGGTEAVSDLDLEIGDGEFMVLVGPSGCGKSTALKMVAGLEGISRGTVAIGDDIVNDLPPRDRDVAMVFQDYALYPHMTVFENLGFALKIRKVRRRGSRTAYARRPRSSVSRTCSIAGRRRCPAVSANAWRWDARSCASRAHS